jgi:PAS domain S-box-containing protein
MDTALFGPYDHRLISLAVICIAVVAALVLSILFQVRTKDRRFSRQTRQLADSQAHLQAIFDNLKESVALLDHGQETMRMNRAAAQLFDLPFQSGSYEKFLENIELLTPDGEPLPRDEWPDARALRGDFLLDLEIGLRNKATGSVLDIAVSSAPIRNMSGEADQTLLTFRNVTERKRTDETQTRLVAIVESSEDAIIGKDAQGVIKSWNRGAEKVFGYTAAEMVGQTMMRLMPPGHEGEEDEIMQRIRRGETVEHTESIRRRKDGVLIHVSLTISPIRDASGRVVGASKIARDITERKRMERQLQQSQKMDALGQLTGGIAHDFNNLLAIILGNLDLLEELVADRPTAVRQVQASQRAATRGAELTRRLLAFARMEVLRPESTSLNGSVQNMIAMATRALGPEITITTKLDESLPHVFVDAAGLESALLNLVVNARDAMPHGGSITVATRLAKLEEAYAPVQAGEVTAGWYACVSVTDTGEGMTKEIVDRAFEPFFTTKPRGKGTGLGLAMIYGFVKQSGGTVRIYSELGVGTTVSMYLLLVPAAKEETAPASKVDELTPMGSTVLVVDDEPDLLTVALAYLEEIGCKGLQAVDAASALEIVERERNIDLMVTDIIMPGGMNGVELARRVHATHPAIKIIYASGFPADALEEKKMELVEGPLLRKPYQRAEFRAMIRGVMEEKKVISD